MGNGQIAVEKLIKGYLVALVEDVGLDAIGICIDTGHRHLHGDVAAALRLVGNHLFTVHIHDNHGDRDAHLLPTLGTIDWPPVLTALAESNYPGVFIYEPGRPEDIGQIRQNFAQMQQRK